MNPDQLAATPETKPAPHQAETVLVRSPEAIVLITTDLMAEDTPERDPAHHIEHPPDSPVAAGTTPADLPSAPAPNADQGIDRFMAEMTLPADLKQTEMRLSA